MTAASFVWRGLWYFRRSYFGVLAATALGAMVLLGALLAGDSVRETLRQIAAARLGKVDVVLAGGDRLFRSALADTLPDMGAAPVLWVKATVSAQGSGRSLGKVQVLGVDRRFWKLGPGGHDMDFPLDRVFLINGHLAGSLGCGVNETLVLRMEKPGLIGRDAPLAGKGADLVALRGRVSGICGDDDFGRFGLETTQVPQATVFVPIDRLAKALGIEGKANMMLMRKPEGLTLEALSCRVAKHSNLEDYGISVNEVPLAKAIELRSARIFFDRKVAAAIRDKFPAAQPVITYLANTIAVNGRETPYSMVTAVDPVAAPFIPTGMTGIVVNTWVAEDLSAKAGDELRIDYYALDGGNRLVERSARFPLAAVVDLTGLAADRQWMPDFPGLAAAEHAAAWDPGVPIDLKRLREKDEAYWDAHRGTPKLFLPLAAGRDLFGNRWGEFTALRVPSASASMESVATGLLEIMTPSLAGWVFQDVGRRGMEAAASPVDFAGLFLGMSLFLMVAAVVLSALMFRFHIEQRNRESGLMDVLGIPAKRILRWRMLEGMCVVGVGSGIGALLALGYTRLLLGSLATIWEGSGGQGLFRIHVLPATLLSGMAVFMLVMMVSIWVVTRRQALLGASLRLEAGEEEVRWASARRVPWWALGFLAAGLGVLAGSGLLGVQGAFFLAGWLMLLAGLAAYKWVLLRRSAVAGELSESRLAQMNCRRRPTRSIVMTGALACGVFLVVSVAAFRKHGGDGWMDRRGGAGGFAFWVETTRVMDRGMASQSGNRMLESGAGRGRFGQVVSLRVGAGDDASCFNLNQVSHPRMLATDAVVLARMGAFPIKQVTGACAKTWSTLGEGDVMRAFVDETTLLWVLKKKLGDRMIYQDEWGKDFPVEIAGTLDSTVFQGSLVVDEARFLAHYPSAEGPRIFLLECAGDLEGGRVVLQRELADDGGVVTTTSERLAAFHGVENTYIAIFHVLGGLGVIVGSAGLGLVTARNLMDRRSEFAILQIVGVPVDVIRRVVMREAWQCICWGLGIGLIAALVAIVPVLSGGGGVKSLAWIGLLVMLIAGHACLWSWFGFSRKIRATRSVQWEIR